MMIITITHEGEGLPPFAYISALMVLSRDPIITSSIKKGNTVFFSSLAQFFLLLERTQKKNS